MTDKHATVRSEKLHKVIDQAIANQTKLQEVRRDLYYFVKNNPTDVLDEIGNSPEFSELTLRLRSALTDSRLAIQRLNDELEV